MANKKSSKAGTVKPSAPKRPTQKELSSSFQTAGIMVTVDLVQDRRGVLRVGMNIRGSIASSRMPINQAKAFMNLIKNKYGTLVNIPEVPEGFRLTQQARARLTQQGIPSASDVDAVVEVEKPKKKPVFYEPLSEESTDTPDLFEQIVDDKDLPL